MACNHKCTCAQCQAEMELVDQIISELFQEEQLIEMLIAWMRIFAQ